MIHSLIYHNIFSNFIKTHKATLKIKLKIKAMYVTQRIKQKDLLYNLSNLYIMPNKDKFLEV